VTGLPQGGIWELDLPNSRLTWEQVVVQTSFSQWTVGSWLSTERQVHKWQGVIPGKFAPTCSGQAVAPKAQGKTQGAVWVPDWAFLFFPQSMDVPLAEHSPGAGRDYSG
jgi:hypothetical protein